MSWIQRLSKSLRSRRHENDLAREIEFHLDMRAREKTAAGMAPEEARCDALQRVGSLDRARDACRDASTLAWVSALGQDLRHAARNAWRHPGFTAAALACMAIGIGANVAIFSFVNAFLFQPLAPGVVMVQRASGNTVSYPEFLDWRRLNTVFDDMFAYTPGERLTIGRGAESVAVLGETVAGGYFSAHAITPLAGRLLTPEDDALPLAVIGYQFWRSHFSADPRVVGQTIWINREAFTIAGIAPRAFHGMLAPWSTDVWVTPYLHREVRGDRRADWLLAGARLKPGVTARQASTAMNSLDAQLGAVRTRDSLVVARRGGLSGSPVWNVFAIMAALLTAVAGIIFLIACADVAGLLMARALARRREIAIRFSLGASRSRLVRQLLTESLLLGVWGAAGGTALAYFAGDTLAGLLPQSISGGFRFEHAIDAHVLAYTLALSVGSALLSGLLPALRASDLKPVSGHTPRLRQALVVGQVAASVLVLATAGIFVRSFQKAAQVDPGWNAARLLTIDLDLRALRYSPARTSEFYARLRDRIAALPGVEAVSIADVLPLGNTRVVNIPGFGQIAAATVDSQYFRAMGIPLVRGRVPVAGGADTLIVNDALARKLWPGEDPVSKPLLSGSVIGVTATGKYWSLNEPPRPFVYQISEKFADSWIGLAVRTSGSPRSLALEIERFNPDLSSVRVQTASQGLSRWLEPQRSAATLLSVLGAMALSLAVTGLYGLLAQLVAQRTPEIAVRMALGASRRRVLLMLLGQTAWLVGAGTAAGIAASMASARVIASLADGVSPLDRVTLLSVAVLLAAVGAAATLAPAYHALRIDPAAALRSE